MAATPVITDLLDLYDVLGVGLGEGESVVLRDGALSKFSVDDLEAKTVSVGETTITGGVVTLTIPTSLWGIDSGGIPYFDDAGAADGEQALLTVDATGALLVVQP